MKSAAVILTEDEVTVLRRMVAVFNHSTLEEERIAAGIEDKLTVVWESF